MHRTALHCTGSTVRGDEQDTYILISVHTYSNSACDTSHNADSTALVIDSDDCKYLQRNFKGHTYTHVHPIIACIGVQFSAIAASAISQTYSHYILMISHAFTFIFQRRTALDSNTHCATASHPITSHPAPSHPAPPIPSLSEAELSSAEQYIV